MAGTGTGNCDLHEDVKSSVWLESMKLRMETKLTQSLRQSHERQQQLRDRLQEIQTEAAEAESNKFRIQDLEQQYAYVEAQLASTNMQHEVMRSTLQANRAADPMTASLRAELRSISQRSAKLQASRDSFVKELQESEEKCQKHRELAELAINEKETSVAPISDPKKEQLTAVVTEAADLELETEKLKQMRAAEEEKILSHLATEKHLQQQLAESDQKLQKALDLQKAESADRVKKLQGELSAKQEVIDRVQTETDQVLLDLQAQQKQYDTSEVEIKECLGKFERSQRNEKQNKKLSARLQSELEQLSQTLDLMQREQQQLVDETERSRRKTWIAPWIATVVAIAGVSLLR